MKETVILSTEKKKLKSGKVVEYWICRWHDHKGRYRSKSLGRKSKLSERQAKKKAISLQAEFENNPAARNIEKMTLKQLADAYMESKKNQWKKNSIKRNRSFINAIVRHFGESTPIKSIRRMDATRWESTLADKKGRNGKATRCTINNYLRVACSMFRFAIENELVLKNPFQSMVTGGQSAEWRYVTAVEFHGILLELPDKYKIVFSLCRLAGLRIDEAMHLHWQDVNFNNNRIHVSNKEDWTTKNGKERFVPICPELQTLLLEAFENAQDGAVKVNNFTFYPQDYKPIEAARERAEVKSYGRPFHTLRKSYITDMANKYPMHVVKEIAGHSKIEITAQYYLKVSDEQYQQCANENLFHSVVNSVVSS